MVISFCLFTLFLSVTCERWEARKYVEPSYAQASNDSFLAVAGANTTFEELIIATVFIEDSECLAAQTESSFTFYLGTLSYDNHFVDWYPIPSSSFNVYNGHRIFSGSIKKPESVNSSLQDCFNEDGDPYCVPTADVLFVQFNNDPIDSWSISNIDVEIQFNLGPENRYVWSYEYSVPNPCSAYFEDTAFYQIGPRPGLFLKFSDDFCPKKGDRIRDYV